MQQFSSDPDFAQRVVDDLYRYRFKSPAVAQLLAIFLGVLGAHRFYLGKTLTGALMFLSAGGGFIWWIYDLFHVRAMVRTHNTIEESRKTRGEPPQRLAFLPAKESLDIHSPPAWAALRGGRLRIYGSFILLSIFGLAMGAISGSTGTYEPTIIVVIFIIFSFVAARWTGAIEVPLIADLTRWIHRLRLYYYSVDPGNIWLSLVRPYIGLLMGVLNTKTRAEVSLYLELGLVFSLGFLVADIVEIAQQPSLASGFGLALAELLQTLIYTYLFVAPIGALLTTQILLSRSDRLIWLLGGSCLLNIWFGLSLTGAI